MALDGEPTIGTLRGRRAECDALDELINAVRHGESRTLVVRGEAGVGKSALFDHAAGAAGELQVLRAAGVESEMELPFAVLHQLCAPLLDSLGRIPGPQQQALDIVFGRSSGPRPDRLLVGLAVLSLLSEAAVERRVLCLIDDAQWLDRATAQILSFVARRLRAEGVGLVFGTRESGEEFFGLPHLELHGLAHSDAIGLLGSVVDFMLDETVRDRIVAETRGNPLALLELPKGLTASQLAEGFGLSGPHSLPGRIEKSFARQVELLPTATRSLLLVAAAEPVGDPQLVWWAAGRLGISAEVATAAPELPGLLTIAERVTFRHPLVRSAVYRSASLRERRAAHLALGEATDPEVDPDRRAWHLATAAAGPDEDVALELERSALRARDRGGFAAEAAFMRRCVALTQDPAKRSERALAGAYASLQVGAFDATLELLVVAEGSPLDALGRAKVDRLRASAAYALNRGNDAGPLLLRVAKALEPLDPALSRSVYLDAWCAALFAGSCANGADLLEVSRAVRSVGPAPDALRGYYLLLDGLTLLVTDGRVAAVPVLEEAVAAFATASSDEVLHMGWLATVAAAGVWDFEACLSIATRQVEVARASGALSVLAVGLNTLCQVVTFAGNFTEAAALTAEFRVVAEASGTHLAPYGSLLLSAMIGRADEVFPFTHEVAERGRAKGQGITLQYTHWARAFVLNGLGRYEEALREAELASDGAPDLFLAAWALCERVEAASRCGDAASAAVALDRLAVHTAGSHSGWALGIEARARALTSAGAAAESHYVEALAQLNKDGPPPEVARAHLLFGEWLRREGRRADARAQLRTAHELFVGMGMEAFAERARRELVATGEVVRKRTAETADELTQQERQIALLVCDGLSNPEVGARLFISPRTVEWHLRKIFTKLNVSSRKELRIPGD